MTLIDSSKQRDHGGGLDGAMAKWGGARSDWLDLSTGINPRAYPLPSIPQNAWTELPDRKAQTDLIEAARQFWQVPEGASIIATPGASALIARIPALIPTGRVDIPEPTYNEHAAAFVAQGWVRSEANPEARVLVHPNNPTGKLWKASDLSAKLNVIDESFCDVTPDRTLINEATTPGTLILKSFGKFWGLAGIRLGFAIGDPALISRLSDFTGPWAVSGPALHVGTLALRDQEWAQNTRLELAESAARLDKLVLSKGASLAGATDLFRLYEVDDAQAWQNKLAEHHIWSRIFPYSSTYLRLGLPAQDRWDQLEAAL